MKRYARAFILGLVAVSLMGNLHLLQARPLYKKMFQEKYPEVVKAQENGRISCTVCHSKKRKKKRNIYGRALEKLLGAKNVKDKQKILQALTKAEKEKSAVEGKTFGDLLKEKKLPAFGEKEQSSEQN